MKNIIKENKTVLAIITGAIIISIGFMVNTAMEQTRKEENDRREETRLEIKAEGAKISFEACREEAYRLYSMDWENACKAKGAGEDCLLSDYISTSLEERKNLEEKTCLDLYKLELN